MDSLHIRDHAHDHSNIDRTYDLRGLEDSQQ
jgi:hypothetical protein